MKSWIYILILFLSVSALCIWDGINTSKIFDNSINKSEKIYNSLLTSTIENEEIKNHIHELNEYWTKKMDTLVISISRKDLQPVSDYLQYIYSTSLLQIPIYRFTLALLFLPYQIGCFVRVFQIQHFARGIAL